MLSLLFKSNKKICNLFRSNSNKFTIFSIVHGNNYNTSVIYSMSDKNLLTSKVKQIELFIIKFYTYNMYINIDK